MSMTSYRCQALSVKEQVDDDDDAVDGMMHDAEGDGTEDEDGDDDGDDDAADDADDAEDDDRHGCEMELCMMNG